VAEWNSTLGEGGGPVRQDQSPKKKSKKKNPEGRSCLGRGLKFPNGELRSSYVLNLGLRLRPVMNRRACGCGARMQVGVFESMILFVVVFLW